MEEVRLSRSPPTSVSEDRAVDKVGLGSGDEYFPACGFRGVVSAALAEQPVAVQAFVQAFLLSGLSSQKFRGLISTTHADFN